MGEEIVNELEALESIYSESFSLRPSVWNQPCFAIKVAPLVYQDDEI